MTKQTTQSRINHPIRWFTELFFAVDEGRHDDTRKPIEELRKHGYRMTLIKPESETTDD